MNHKHQDFTTTCPLMLEQRKQGLLLRQALRYIQRRNGGDSRPLSIAFLVTDHCGERFSGPGLVRIPEQCLEKLGNPAAALRVGPLDGLTFQGGICQNSPQILRLAQDIGARTTLGALRVAAKSAFGANLDRSWPGAPAPRTA